MEQTIDEPEITALCNRKMTSSFEHDILIDFTYSDLNIPSATVCYYTTHNQEL